MRKLVVVLLLAPVLVGCGSGDSKKYCTDGASKGCTQVPTKAKKADFCAAGATFSDSKGFANGQKAAEALAAVGTPSDITASARAGFVELVERMADAKSGPEFKATTQNLPRDNPSASKHLLDLDTYIHSACTS